MSYPPQQPYYYQVPPPPPAKKGLSGGMIFGIIAGVLALCLCGAALVGVVLWQGGFFKAVAEGAASEELASAKVGDCITSPYKGVKPKIVDCADGDAHMRIKRIVVDQSKTQGATECRTVNNVADTYFVPDSPGATKGKSLCLGPNR